MSENLSELLLRKSNLRYFVLVLFFVFCLSFFVSANAFWGMDNVFPFSVDVSDTFDDWELLDKPDFGGEGLLSLKLVQDNQGNEYVFAIGSDNKVYYDFDNNWYRLENGMNPDGIFAKEINPIYDAGGNRIVLYTLNHERRVLFSILDLHTKSFTTYYPAQTGELYHRQFLSIEPVISRGNVKIDEGTGKTTTAIFGIGLDNQVYYTYVKSGITFERWQSLGGWVSEIDAVPSPDVGGFAVFAVGTDDNVYVGYNTDGIGSWSEWSPIGDYMSGQSIQVDFRKIETIKYDVGSDKGGMAIFGIGKDNRLYYSERILNEDQRGYFSHWEDLGGWISDLSVTRWSWDYGEVCDGYGKNFEGFLVAGVGASNNAYVTYQILNTATCNIEWRNWHMPRASDPIRSWLHDIELVWHPDKGMSLVGRGGDGALWVLRQNEVGSGSDWDNRWSSGLGVGRGIPRSMTEGVIQIESAINKDGNLEVFVLGADYRVRHAVKDDYGNWKDFGIISTQSKGNFFLQIKLGRRNDGELELYAIERYTGLWHSYRQGDSWSDFIPIRSGDPSYTSSQPEQNNYVSDILLVDNLRDGRQIVFVRTKRNGHVYYIFQDGIPGMFDDCISGDCFGGWSKWGLAGSDNLDLDNIVVKERYTQHKLAYILIATVSSNNHPDYRIGDIVYTSQSLENVREFVSWSNWSKFEDSSGGGFSRWAKQLDFERYTPNSKNNNMGKPYIFAVGGLNTLYGITQPTSAGGSFGAHWGEFNTLGLAQKVKVVRDANNRIIVFALRGDNTLAYYLGSDPAASMENWISLGGWVEDFEIIKDSEGTLGVLGIGSDNALYIATQLGPGSDYWNSWRGFGGWLDDFDFSDEHQGKFSIIVSGSDGRLYYRDSKSNVFRPDLYASSIDFSNLRCEPISNEFVPLKNNSDFSSSNFLGYISSVQKPGMVPLYQLYNNARRGFYKYSLVSESDLGYNLQGTVGYIFRTQQPGTVPLYKIFHNNAVLETGSYISKDYYVTDLAERDRIVVFNENTSYQGILGYIYPNDYSVVSENENQPSIFYHPRSGGKTYLFDKGRNFWQYQDNGWHFQYISQMNSSPDILPGIIEQDFYEFNPKVILPYYYGNYDQKWGIVFLNSKGDYLRYKDPVVVEGETNIPWYREDSFLNSKNSDFGSPVVGFYYNFLKNAGGMMIFDSEGNIVRFESDTNSWHNTSIIPGTLPSSSPGVDLVSGGFYDFGDGDEGIYLFFSNGSVYHSVYHSNGVTEWSDVTSEFNYLLEVPSQVYYEPNSKTLFLIGNYEVLFANAGTKFHRDMNENRVFWRTLQRFSCDRTRDHFNFEPLTCLDINLAYSYESNIIGNNPSGVGVITEDGLMAYNNGNWRNINFEDDAITEIERSLVNNLSTYGRPIAGFSYRYTSNFGSKGFAFFNSEGYIASVDSFDMTYGDKPQMFSGDIPDSFGAHKAGYFFDLGGPERGMHIINGSGSFYYYNGSRWVAGSNLSNEEILPKKAPVVAYSAHGRIHLFYSDGSAFIGRPSRFGIDAGWRQVDLRNHLGIDGEEIIKSGFYDYDSDSVVLITENKNIYIGDTRDLPHDSLVFRKVFDGSICANRFDVHGDICAPGKQIIINEPGKWVLNRNINAHSDLAGVCISIQSDNVVLDGARLVYPEDGGLWDDDLYSFEFSCDNLDFNCDGVLDLEDIEFFNELWESLVIYSSLGLDWQIILDTFDRDLDCNLPKNYVSYLIADGVNRFEHEDLLLKGVAESRSFLQNITICLND